MILPVTNSAFYVQTTQFIFYHFWIFHHQNLILIYGIIIARYNVYASSLVGLLVCSQLTRWQNISYWCTETAGMIYQPYLNFARFANLWKLQRYNNADVYKMRTWWSASNRSRPDSRSVSLQWWRCTHQSIQKETVLHTSNANGNYQVK